MKIIGRFLVTTVISGLVIAAAPPTDHRIVAVDTAHSKMTVYVYKTGIFAFAADNHEVNAPISSGTYDESTKKMDVKVDAAKMEVLDPKMPADRRAQVQANMVGDGVLEASRYKTIEFRSTSVDATTEGHWNVTGDLTLHGQTHPITVQVTKVDAQHFSGAGVVRQTDFGITPIRIAGGTVRVKDDVKIVFDIAINTH